MYSWRGIWSYRYVRFSHKICVSTTDCNVLLCLSASVFVYVLQITPQNYKMVILHLST